MLLESNGIDVWYVDESSDANYFAVSALAIPLLRPRAGGQWAFEWEDHLAAVRKWRRLLSQTHGLPVRKELHAVKLVSGRGHYRRGRTQFGKHAAAGVYRWVLSSLGFLPSGSVITITARTASNLYGHTRLEAAMHALFQRMQRASKANGRNGLVFFDEGHGEYRKLYRQARVHLPTGSSLGSWGKTSSANMPMDLFFKDANFKQSQHSHFVQVVDLVAYAALLKIRDRYNALTPWQQHFGLGTAYDSIPVAALNTRASRTDPLGIVWL